MPRSSLHTIENPHADQANKAFRVRLMLHAGLILAVILAGGSRAVLAQMPRDFNACLLFTAEDASAALGGPATPEAIKAKAPKTVTQCNYVRQDAARAQAASASFRFYRSAAEALAALKESRLEVRGRPLIINGQDAYWHPKAAQLVVTKGNTLVVLQVGSLLDAERDPETARKAAERLLPRLGG